MHRLVARRRPSDKKQGIVTRQEGGSVTADQTVARLSRQSGQEGSRIRLNVLRALGADVHRAASWSLPRAVSVSALAGAEVVGDVRALQAATLYGNDIQINDIGDLDDGIGQGARVVGNITVNGESVPVRVFAGDGDDANITIAGIGEVAIGNLSTSRKYIRLLTCAQVAAVRNQVSDEENEVEICRFVQKHCKPRAGLLNYLQLPYCDLKGAPFIGGLLLLVWAGVLFIWLTAQVPFLIPSLHTMSKICGMSQTVAGVTFLAFGNGCADLFSMLAATLSGPGMTARGARALSLTHIPFLDAYRHPQPTRCDSMRVRTCR